MPILINKNQSGFTLFMVLIILVAMILLSAGVIRTTDTGNQVANNISFKQATLHSADSGIEQAIVTLNAVSDKLHDSPANGYYATEQTGTDFTGTLTPNNAGDDVSWDGASGATRRAFVGTAVDGSRIAYIIHRLCSKQGGLTTADDGAANSCAISSTASSSGGSKGGGAYDVLPISMKSQIYYRITVRSEGARNTVSYVQSKILVEY